MITWRFFIIDNLPLSFLIWGTYHNFWISGSGVDSRPPSKLPVVLPQSQRYNQHLETPQMKLAGRQNYLSFEERKFDLFSPNLAKWVGRHQFQNPWQGYCSKHLRHLCCQGCHCQVLWTQRKKSCTWCLLFHARCQFQHLKVLRSWYAKTWDRFVSFIVEEAVSVTYTTRVSVKPGPLYDTITLLACIEWTDSIMRASGARTPLMAGGLGNSPKRFHDTWCRSERKHLILRIQCGWNVAYQ